MTALLTTLSGLLVFATGVWLTGLAIATWTRPANVRRFFDGFASSASAHFLEMFSRLLAGAAFVFSAPRMKFSTAFQAFGWLLIVTTSILILLPWKLHRKFAGRSLPMLYEWMRLFGAVSLLAGSFILYSHLFG